MILHGQFSKEGIGDWIGTRKRRANFADTANLLAKSEGLRGPMMFLFFLFDVCRLVTWPRILYAARRYSMHRIVLRGPIESFIFTSMDSQWGSEV